MASAKGIKLVATAQEILEEALDKLPRAGIDKEVFEDRNLNTVYGWLGCTLATVLLPGKATPANAKVDAEVRMYRAGLEYVQKLQAHFPKMDPTYLTPPWQSMLEAARQRVSAQGVAATWLASAKAAAASGAAGEGSRKAVLRLEEIRGGRVDDALAELREKGLDIGMHVCLRDAPSGDQLWDPKPSVPRLTIPSSRRSRRN